MKKKIILGLFLIIGCLFVFSGCKSKANGEKDLNEAMYIVEKTYGLSDKEGTARAYYGTSFDLMSKYAPLNVTLQWDAKVTKGQATDVAIEESASDSCYKVKLDKFVNHDVEFDLTVTAKKDKKTISRTYKLGQKEFVLSSPAFLLEKSEDGKYANVGKTVNVRGIVTGVINATTFYMQSLDNTGGFYVYQCSAEKGSETAKVGDQVVLCGAVITDYSGTIELCKDSGTAYSVESHNNKFTPIDLTEAFKNAKDGKVEDLTKYQGAYVYVNRVAMDKIEDSYLRFDINNVHSYVRISSSSCMLNSADQATIKSMVVKGKECDVTGCGAIFDGLFYLVPCDVNSIVAAKLPATDDAGEVAYTKAKVAEFAQETYANVSLPTTYKYNDDEITIAWTSDKADIMDNTGKILQYSATDDVKVTYTAVITKGTATDNTTVEITVKKLPVSKISVMNTVYLNGTNANVYMIEGKVVSMDTKGNAFVADGTGVTYAYGLKGKLADVEVNDTVQVIGYVCNYSNSNKQLCYEFSVIKAEKKTLDVTICNITKITVDMLTKTVYENTNGVISEDGYKVCVDDAVKFTNKLFEIKGKIIMQESKSGEKTYQNYYITVGEGDNLKKVMFYGNSDLTLIKDYAGKDEEIVVICPMVDYSGSRGWELGTPVSVSKEEAANPEFTSLAKELNANVYTEANKLAKPGDYKTTESYTIIGKVSYRYISGSLSYNGFIVEDKTGGMYCYKGPDLNVQPGNIVKVTGKLAYYNGCVELCVDELYVYDYSEAFTWTGADLTGAAINALEAKGDDLCAEYTVVGTIKCTDTEKNYFSLTIDGCEQTIQLNVNKTELINQLKAVDNKKVKLQVIYYSIAADTKNAGKNKITFCLAKFVEEVE